MSWQFTCPKGWEIVNRWGDGYACQQTHGGLRILIDCEIKEDQNEWIHVSVSRKAWIPTHADMALVKHDFIGDVRYAYSVWPPAEFYVNIHPHCLHLWAKVDGSDGRVLPEFSDVIPELGGKRSI